MTLKRSRELNRRNYDLSLDDGSEDESENMNSARSQRSLRRVVSYNEDEEDTNQLSSNEGENDKQHTNGDELQASKHRNNYKFEREDKQETEEHNDSVRGPEEEVRVEGDEEYKEDEYKEDEEEDEFRPRKRQRKRKIQSDDSDFEESLSEESDEFLEDLNEKNFVASDDDLSEDFGYKKRRSTRNRSTSREFRKRGRPPKSRSKGPDEDELLSAQSDENSIQKEIEDLYDSSPSTTPVKHKLRERDHKVDYTLPPPITNDTSLEQRQFIPPQSTGRGRKPNKESQYRKLLFPTAGPFGGSDVISLFGTNIPPGGIPSSALANSNLGPIGQNMSSSDSSDDEIAPINGEATISKKPKKDDRIMPPRLISSGSSERKDKEKNNLSDTDPLGIDMNIDFSAIGGLDDYIDQLKEMVALPLLYPELYQNFGITPPRGVLFHGPPGTGKTLMARALAASCSTQHTKITFFMRKGADCLSKWVGEAERQLRLLFEEAKNQQPSIIFFDEIDGLAPVRSSKQEQIHASIVSTLLALMDGMDNRGQVIVIGATNRPDAVDPALRRPGRFDREFYFPLPNLKARLLILKIQTKKWKPPLPESFLEKVSRLTKGYGGADLRALCTEAALNSIQRKYPQIYQTNEKLEVDPSKIRVTANDFMKAIEKIVPSSARSTYSGSAPLPKNLMPLLSKPFNEITEKLRYLMPTLNSNSKTTKLEDAMYLDPTVKDPDGGFSRREFFKTLESLRVCKPHILIHGPLGYGQQYLSSAVLNFLEGFQVHSLDVGNLFGDPVKTPELVIVHAFVEAKRHQPSVILIPNIEIWENAVPHSAKITLSGLLHSLPSNEQILLLAVSEMSSDALPPSITKMLSLKGTANSFELINPSRLQREEYFVTLRKALETKPCDFIFDIENRPKRKLKKLKVAPIEKDDNSQLIERKKQKKLEYEDTRLKNILKLKLAALMDLFKNRYKRFKKPIIDDSLLYHLFDPSILNNPVSNYEVLYTKSEDKDKENMIKEVSTGKYYYNMDLDIIEERLWNGYYSEPKQFLRDLKMIVKDSITSGDRERILKANEMLTNAQFGIDEFSTPEFVKACKEMRHREILKQKRLFEEHKKLEEEFKKKEKENMEKLANGDRTLLDTNTDKHNREKVPKISEGEDAQDNLNVKDVSDRPNLLTQHESSIMNGSGVSEQLSKGRTLPPPETNEVLSEKTALDDNNMLKSESRSKTLSRDEETASELESDETNTEEQSRDLILGPHVDKLFNEELLDLTENYCIEELESLMSQLMEIVWEDRKMWDRSETVNRLINCIASIR